jgi:hypothetical protein
MHTNIILSPTGDYVDLSAVHAERRHSSANPACAGKVLIFPVAWSAAAISRRELDW